MPGDRHDGLNRPLAEALRAHDDRALVILQRTRDDLGGRSGAAVDENHDGQSVRQITGTRVEALGIVLVASTRRDDLATVEERVGHLHGLVEQSARVAPQIEDEPDHLVAEFFLDVGHRGLEAVVGLLVEGRDPDITDLALDTTAHRLDAHHIACDRHIKGFLALAANGQPDVRADPPTHLVHGLRESKTEHRLAIEMGDEITRLDAGARRRGIVDRRHHPDEPLLHGDLDTEPAELAARLHLHVAEALLVQVARVRVQRLQHAVDRGLDQLLVRGLVDILGPHPFEDVAEQFELPEGLFVGLRRNRGSGNGRQHRRKCKRGDQFTH